MADLIETDEEPVEKAAPRGLIARGSRFMGARAARALNFTPRRAAAATYLSGRRKNFATSGGFRGVRSGVYKSSDPVAVLYAEIEKARGLLPKGGSKRMLGIISANYRGGPVSAKNVARKDRLRRLHAGLRQRLVRKSADPLDTLYAEIEKARGLIPRGGSSKLARNIDQRRRKGDLKWSANEGKNRQAARAIDYLRTRKYTGRFSLANGRLGLRSVGRGKYK